MRRINAFFRSSFGAGLAGGLMVAVLGAVALSTGLIKAESDGSGPTTFAPVPPFSKPVAAGQGLSVGEVYDRAAPAVAYIEAAQAPEPPSPFSPFPQRQGTATGSGFLMDDQGHVLTNAHVVDGSDSVTVTLGEDGETLDAKVLGADDSTDVAVLEIEPDQAGASPLPLGDSDHVGVGDPVVAIGNPFGLDRTVTSGIISALQRQISAPDGFTISDVIQTDAAINPGNSGGPLIDAAGQVIGINSQIETGGSGGFVGVGFAVPINTARDVASQIIEGGRVEHAFLGITGTDLDPQIADVLNLDVDSGALVQDVSKGSPAAEAGIESGTATVSIDGRQIRAGGDIITSVDGGAVGGMDDLIAIVNEHQPGDEIRLGFIRDGGEREITVKLGDRPASATP